MYRETIKIMDCTVRDGGLMNAWQFDDDFVKGIYTACVDAGIDYMEIGYKSSEHAYSREENGPWKFCDETDLRRIVGDNNTDLKLSAMADIGRIDEEDIPQASDSVIDMLRVACYTHQVDKGIALAEHVLDKGYETTLNIMAVSTTMERDLDEALNDIAKSRVKAVYIVDSFGSMYSEQIQSLCEKYRSILGDDVTLGFHGHNNQQLAYANTVEAVIRGVDMLDGSLLGMGRGAGNCPTELLLGFLKNPKYSLRPALQAIQDQMIPMQQKVDWGYHLPYMIVGMLNQHPRSAMACMDGDDRNNLTGFFDKVTDEAIID